MENNSTLFFVENIIIFSQKYTKLFDKIIINDYNVGTLIEKGGLKMAQTRKVIRKIGTSLGVIIDSVILRQARMIEGDKVNVTCEDEKIVISRAKE